MSLTDPTRPSAPIPGANYTSDTRNWPWHRPPDITDIDECLDYVVETLTETDAGMRYMSMIEVGMPITSITDIIVTLGIGRGKWTPDFAIIVAGPVAKVLEIMAKSYNIEYELGIDEDPEFRSSVYYETLAENNGDTSLEEETDELPEVEKDTKDEAGFMSASSAEEQLSMLGYGDNEEIEELENE